MTKEYNYRDLCPEGGDPEEFNRIICNTIKNWPRLTKSPKSWPAPAEVNAELKKLRKAIKNLSDYTREHIIFREFINYDFLSPEWRAIENGNSSLQILEKTLVGDYERLERADGEERRKIKTWTLTWWDKFGGIKLNKKTCKVYPVNKESFLLFLERFIEDIGKDEDSEEIYKDIFYRQVSFDEAKTLKAKF